VRDPPPDPWDESGPEETSRARGRRNVGTAIVYIVLFLLLVMLPLIAFLRAIVILVDFLTPDPGAS
jgi:hypothetical protein